MSDQTETETETPEVDNRFVWTQPLLRLAPDEVYVPASIDELLEGKAGRIVKNPDLVPEPAVVASAADDAKGSARARHPSSRWRKP